MTPNDRGWLMVAVAAGLEIATGLAMIAAPSVMIDLMFRSAGAATIVTTRVAGSGLLCLGLACWPRTRGAGARAVLVLLGYNVLAALYLIRLGLSGVAAGPLLWPAAVTHGVLALLLGRRSARTTVRQ